MPPIPTPCWICSGGVLHIGYFLILPRLDAAELSERLARARQAGTVTVLDVATPGPGSYLERLKVVLPHTDVFVPNTDEAELILGETDPVRQARIFHDLGARQVVITRGELGVVSVSDSLRVRLGTYPIAFVDGSGGGDAFNAGYIAGLLEGRSELDCPQARERRSRSQLRPEPSAPQRGSLHARWLRPKSSSATMELTVEPIFVRRLWDAHGISRPWGGTHDPDRPRVHRGLRPAERSRSTDD